MQSIHWFTPLMTPLMVSAAHIPLNADERDVHRDVLTWLEKRPSPTRTMERGCTLIDTDELEDEEMRSDDEDNEDGGTEFSVPSSSASDSVLGRHSSTRDDASPRGFMAKWSRKLTQAAAVPPSPLAGISSSDFFEPSKWFDPDHREKLTPLQGPYADLDIRRIIIERELVPEILLSGLITCEEARSLFDL
jgi:hypothetical protein